MSATFTGPVPVPAPQSSPLSILVTGAARGIGLELVKQYSNAHPNNIVLAGVRDVNNSQLLSAFVQSRHNVSIIPLDVNDENSIKSSVKHVLSVTDHVDILINNAGVMGASDPGTIKGEEMLRVLSTNVVGPLLVVQSYLPLLQRSALPGRVISVSSALGSNEYAYKYNVPFISYGTSKAALNFINTTLKHVYPSVVFLSIHPGWVATDMGKTAGAAPPTSVADSAQAIIYYTQQKTLANSGEFLDITTAQSLPF